MKTKPRQKDVLMTISIIEMCQLNTLDGIVATISKLYKSNNMELLHQDQII